MTTHKTSKAFTLIELLVVIAIISILVGLTIPAVQSVRVTARSLSCKNNLRNIGLAVSNYEANLGHYPPSFEVDPGTTVRGSWSIHARIMPYLEEDNAFKQIDFDVDWHDQVDSGVPFHRVPVYTCPAELNDITRVQADGSDFVHGTNYGFNMGSWFIHDPTNNRTGDGAFRVNRPTKHRDMQDGLSTTLCAVDVQNYTSYIRNADTVDSTFPDSTTFFEGVTGDLRLGPSLSNNTGHTVWCDGRVHHTGFTTVYGPNTDVSYTLDGQQYSIDFTTQQEGRDLTRATFAAITARSYHPAGVNGMNMDGSVHFYSSSIDLTLWRALGTVNGQEVVDVRSFQ